MKRSLRRRPSPASRALALALALAALAAPPIARAAEWTYLPSMRYQIELNDNRRLRFTEEKEAIGHIVRLGTELRYRTERTELSLTPELSFERWWGDHALDTDDQQLSFEGSHVTERWRFELAADAERDSTLSTDFATPDSARITVRKRRDTLSAAPAVTYQISQRTTATVNASTQLTMFPRSGNTGLIDFTFNAVSASLQHVLGERRSVSVTALRTVFEADSIDARTDTVGIGVGHGYQYSPTLGGSITASFRTSEIDNRALPKIRRENGFSATVTATRQYERGEATVTVSRDLSPTLSGFLIQRDQQLLTWDHRFLERLSGRLELRFDQDVSLGDVSIAEDQDRTLISARLNYRLHRDWTLTGTYRFVQTTTDTRPDPAQSNALWFAVRYSPLRRTIH